MEQQEISAMEQVETLRNQLAAESRIVLLLQKQVEELTLQTVLHYLSVEQVAAMKGKLANNSDKAEWLAMAPGQDIVTAYFVAGAVKESNDRIFSVSRNSYVFEILREYQRLILTDNEAVRLLAENTILGIKRRCDEKQCAVLCTLVRKELLAGKTAMPPQILGAFLQLCETMAVDPETLK